MSDPDPSGSPVRFIAHRLFGSLAKGVVRIAAFALASGGVFAVLGGALTGIYRGWSAVPFGLGFGAAIGLVVALGLVVLCNGEGLDE
jgi:hypothetical protein